MLSRSAVTGYCTPRHREKSGMRKRNGRIILNRANFRRYIWCRIDDCAALCAHRSRAILSSFLRFVSTRSSHLMVAGPSSSASIMRSATLLRDVGLRDPRSRGDDPPSALVYGLAGIVAPHIWGVLLQRRSGTPFRLVGWWQPGGIAEKLLSLDISPRARA